MNVSVPGCILSSSCIPTAAEFCIHPPLRLATAPWFVYPEAIPSSAYYLETLAKRPNLGIALGGGGYRAVTTALGYIRLVRTGNFQTFKLLVKLPNLFLAMRIH